MADQAARVGVHPLVDALMPEAGGDRRVALVGYPGPSTTDDKVRLYTDLSFGTFLEFPAAAVVKAVPARTDDENSPTVVIVDARTKVEKVAVERSTNEAAFLSGAISTAHYGAAHSAGGADIAARAGIANCVCYTRYSYAASIDAAAAGPFKAVGAGSFFGCAPTDNINCGGERVEAKTVTLSYSCLVTCFGCHDPMIEVGAVGTRTCVYTYMDCVRPGPAQGQPRLGAPQGAAVMTNLICMPTGIPYLCPTG